MAALFAKMQGRYGHRWISAYPAGEILDAALAEWAEGLAGMTGEDIKLGLDTWDSAWPPTLPEFRKACCDHHSTAPEHKPFPALPKPWNPVLGKQHIEKMREILRHGDSRRKTQPQTERT